ncbi:MAG: nitroreductase family deazaflavin-dependent oxidoreductase [Deltaproteobacteria bacterium]|nr:nitroreductase family deazaflavin-dependent oxidoreductase [Deltaproteobacteria bacterium]
MMQRDEATKPLWQRTLWAVAFIALILEGAPGWLRAEEAKTVARTDLEKVASQSTVEITTTGRKSGKPHTMPIWFVYDQGHFYLQSGKGGKSDWYLNLKKNPQLSLKIDALTFSGKAKFVEDAQETERIHGLFSSKYLLARAAGAVGSSIGHGKPIEVEIQ